MENNYASMTEQELIAEVARLKEKARKAEALGIVNEYAVYERRALMASAYLVDLDTLVMGEMYRLDGAPGEFFVLERLKGRFAWGYRLGGNKFEEAIPVSMLLPMKVGK
jgi:hypothetical protein